MNAKTEHPRPTMQISPGRIGFSDSDENRAQVNLGSLIEDYQQTGDPSRLLAFGTFFQLVDVNHRLDQVRQVLGLVDMEKGEGSGLWGTLAQLALSGVETSERTGRTVEALETMLGRAGDAAPGVADVGKLIADAIAQIQKAAGPSPQRGNGSGEG